MAQCTDCDATIKYKGNGSQKTFTFQFEYREGFKTTDIHVAQYDEEKREYVDLTYGTDWLFKNPTVVEFAVPPTTTIVIYRCTDIDQMQATFYPGYSVKAEDLNNDFNQLRLAVEEGRCGIGSLKEEIRNLDNIYLNKINVDNDGDLVKSNSTLTIDDEHVATTQWIDNRYWDRCEETTYSADTWVNEIDDAHIPTTGAVEERLVTIIKRGGFGLPSVVSVNGKSGIVSLGLGDLTDVETDSVGHIPTNGQALVWNANMNHWMPGTANFDAPVDSVNGQTGEVVLNASDVGAIPVGGAVTKIIAGDNITLNPAIGTGDVTIYASGSDGLPEAPNDGKQYGRQSEAWTEIISSGSGGGDSLWQESGVTLSPIGNATSISLPGTITAAGTSSFGDTVYISSSSDTALSIGKSGTGYGGTWDADGNIKLGTNLFVGAEDIKLTLNAADGSASFEGQVDCSSDGNNVASLVTNGYFQSDRTLGTSSVFEGQLNGTSTVSIIASGDATFAGSLDIGSASLGSGSGTFNTYLNASIGSDYFIASKAPGDLSTSPILFGVKTDGSVSFAGGAFKIESDGDISTNIRGQGNIELDSTGAFTDPKVKLFAATGAATFTGGITTADNITVSRTLGTSACYVGQLNGSDTSSINADGSASFTGTLTVEENINGLKAISGSGTGSTPVVRVYSDSLSKYTTNLNADGSALFTGSVEVGDSTPWSSPTKTGTHMAAGGSVETYRDVNGSTNGAYSAYYKNPNGNNDKVFSVNMDGSAIFGTGYKVGIRPFDGDTADQLYIDKTDGTRTFSVLGNGTATFAGDLSCANSTIRAVTSSGHGLLRVLNSSFVDTAYIDGSTGDAKFDGDITLGDYSTNGSTTGIKLNPDNNGNGALVVQGGGTSDMAVGVYDGAGKTYKASVFHDGTAYFAGTVDINNPSTSGIRLSSAGSATFTGSVTAGESPTSGANTGSQIQSAGVITACRADSLAIWYGWQEGNTTETSVINADGTATFASTVTAGGFSMANLAQL